MSAKFCNINFLEIPCVYGIYRNDHAIFEALAKLLINVLLINN